MSFEIGNNACKSNDAKVEMIEVCHYGVCCNNGKEKTQ